MSNPTTPRPEDALAGNPIVIMAADALVTFGIEHRADAERALPLWRWYGELTDRERAAILALFDGEPDDGDGDDGEPSDYGTGMLHGLETAIAAVEQEPDRTAALARLRELYRAGREAVES